MKTEYKAMLKVGEVSFLGNVIFIRHNEKTFWWQFEADEKWLEVSSYAEFDTIGRAKRDFRKYGNFKEDQPQ